MESVVKVNRVAKVTGEIRPPSDKSLTHRAYLFASLAEGGTSVIREPLTGQDCENTLAIMGHLGRTISRAPNSVSISGGGHRLAQPSCDLDCGNSGTTMRLLAGVLASEPGLTSTMFGDASLSKRPMKRVVEPLTMMGAEITGTTAPLTIHGKRLSAIDYTSPVASAQVKSCVLLAGLRASEGFTWVTEPSHSRDHTEKMLSALGVNVLRESETRVGLEAGQSLRPFEFEVPADISSAAFWAVLAACFAGSEVTLSHVGMNPSRTGLIDVLEQAGAEYRVTPRPEELGEAVGDLWIRGGKALKAFEVSGSLVPRLIDEIPVLAVLATQCQGKTVFRDAKELRVKESDRIELVTNALARMGAKVESFEDGFSVEGPVDLKGTEVEAHGDHRIAMAFAIAGMIAEGDTTLLNAESIATSYPNFWQHAEVLTHA